MTNGSSIQITSSNITSHYFSPKGINDIRISPLHMDKVNLKRNFNRLSMSFKTFFYLYDKQHYALIKFNRNFKLFKTIRFALYLK